MTDLQTPLVELHAAPSEAQEAVVSATEAEALMAYLAGLDPATIAECSRRLARLGARATHRVVPDSRDDQ